MAFQHPSRRAVLSTLAIGLALSPAVASGTGGIAGRTLQFNKTRFIHRWHKDGQHEFTPEAETDLARWTNMVTINLHRAATNGEKLAEIANRIVGNYRQNGRILKTASKPATATDPAEHFIVAMFGRPSFLEAAFTRIHLVNGIGFATTYGRRVYGEKVGPEMSKWLADYGSATEAALMGWSDPATFAAIASA
jgi:hypothetical protein